MLVRQWGRALDGWTMATPTLGRREHSLLRHAPTPEQDAVPRRFLGTPHGMIDFSQRGQHDCRLAHRPERRTRRFDRDWRRAMDYWRELGNLASD